MFKSRSQTFYGGHEDEINCLVFSKDLEILLTASIDGYIRLWNTVHEHLTFKIAEKAGVIRSLTISNNDRYFASTASDSDVRLYATRTGSLLYRLKGHTHVSDCLQFSSDSQFIASGSWDCRTILWDVVTGEPMYNFHHHTSAVQSISFHPILNLMVTGSHDHNVILYDLNQSSSSTPVIFQGHFGNVRALAFSHLPYFASAGWDKIIIVWHMELLRMRARLFGHTGWIHAIAFADHENEDGSLLASADDEMVRVWNIITNQCIHKLAILNDLSCCLRFIPNRGGILVGGAVYEFFADQYMSPKERAQTRRIREPITGETVMMSKQSSLLPRLKRRQESVKPPTVKTRPCTQQVARTRRK